MVVLTLSLPFADPADAAPGCLGKRATIVSSAAKIIGTKAHDVIVVKGKGRHVIDGVGGNDRICGSPGDDVIRGSKGNDRVFGAAGDDRILGGPGNDRADGGPGNDWLDGEKGNDDMRGGAGDDTVIGLNGDDKVAGDAGDDTVIGGAGTDKLYGGSEDDILRGEGNSDLMDGGPGNDISSFSSAPTAVEVDLRKSGMQVTNDGNDTLIAIEDLVGSPFADTLNGDAKANRIDGGPGYDYLEGGGGGDTAFGGSDGAECVDFDEDYNCGPAQTPGDGTAVILSRGLDGDSLVISGDGADNVVTVGQTETGWTVEDTGPTGVYVGDFENSGCNLGLEDGQAVCPGSGRLNLAIVTGGDGDDELRIAPGFPGEVPVRMNGGDGSDLLFGGPGDDVLEAGLQYREAADGGPTSGRDELYGGEGSDSLFADRGADILSSGPGNDLLVSSKDVCNGHTLIGGAGKDNASWALVDARRSSYSGRMSMALGGKGGPVGMCPDGLDTVSRDIEDLEGSRLDDTLIGTSGPNGFLGQAGSDIFLGNGGRDYIDARDGEPDRKIDCGGGSAIVLKDGMDPRPLRCRPR